MPSLKRRNFLQVLSGMLGLATISSPPKPSSASSTPLDTSLREPDQWSWTNDYNRPVTVEFPAGFVHPQRYTLYPTQTITLEGPHKPTGLVIRIHTVGGVRRVVV